MRQLYIHFFLSLHAISQSLASYFSHLNNYNGQSCLFFLQLIFFFYFLLPYEFFLISSYSCLLRVLIVFTSVLLWKVFDKKLNGSQVSQVVNYDQNPNQNLARSEDKFLIVKKENRMCDQLTDNMCRYVLLIWREFFMVTFLPIFKAGWFIYLSLFFIYIVIYCYILLYTVNRFIVKVYMYIYIYIYKYIYIYNM